MLTRRQFIRAGLVGSLLLAGAGAWHFRPRGGERQALDADARELLAALVPVIAGPEAAPLRDEVVEGVATAVGGLAPASQEELRQLFGLLSIAALRGPLTGVWSDWKHAEPAALAAFLQRWRDSRLVLLRSAYQALHDLVLGAWYADPRSWPAIGYAGPPEVA